MRLWRSLGCSQLTPKYREIIWASSDHVNENIFEIYDRKRDKIKALQSVLWRRLGIIQSNYGDSKLPAWYGAGCGERPCAITFLQQSSFIYWKDLFLKGEIFPSRKHNVIDNNERNMCFLFPQPEVLIFLSKPIESCDDISQTVRLIRKWQSANVQGPTGISLGMRPAN